MFSSLRSVLKSQQGMSLIEILIALTLMAIAGTFVVGKVFDQLESGKKDAARIQIKALSDRLKEFRRDCGYYPTSDQGLDALLNKPTGGRECKRYNQSGYIDGGKIPVDPWDTEYVYESDGKNFTIKSLGSDAEEGTEDDISSQNL